MGGSTPRGDIIILMFDVSLGSSNPALGPGALWGAVLCIGGCSAVLASSYWMPVAAPHIVISSTVSRHCRVSIWEGQNGSWWRTTALSSQCPCFSERKSDLGTVTYCSGAKPGRGPGANFQPRALPPSCVLSLSDQFLSHGSATVVEAGSGVASTL